MNKIQIQKAKERLQKLISLIEQGVSWQEAAKSVGYRITDDNHRNAMTKHNIRTALIKYDMPVPDCLYAKKEAATPDDDDVDIPGVIDQIDSILEEPDIVPPPEQSTAVQAEPAASTDDIDAAIALLQAEKDRRLSGVTDVKRVINDLVKVVYADAQLHGLYEAYDAMDNAQRKRMKLACMIMGECGEAAGASDSPEAWKEELADIVLSVLSVAGYMGVMDFGEVLEKKRQFNINRPYQHKGE